MALTECIQASVIPIKRHGAWDIGPNICDQGGRCGDESGSSVNDSIIYQCRDVDSRALNGDRCILLTFNTLITSNNECTNS